MNKIKVGDKIEVVKGYLECSGQKGTIVSIDSYFEVIIYTVELESGSITYLQADEIKKENKESGLKKAEGKIKYFGEVGVGCARRIYILHLEKEEEEMEYEVGKPYLWFGGECPLPKGTKVKVRFGDKDFSNIRGYWVRGGYQWNAEKLEWQHIYGDVNIVMFEVVEYPKSTRKVEMELTEEEITTIKGILGKVNL